MTLELSLVDRKDVITKDGRKIGSLIGANLDTTSWVVHSIIVEVNKEIIKDLKVKKSVLKLPKINVKTNLVSGVGDVVQLTVDLKSLSEYV